MQAHPLSIPAARLPFQSPAPSATAQPLSPASTRATFGLRRPSAPDPGPSLSIPRSTNPPAGIAQCSGLAHDAGNLLGALGLYCDLLRAPGILRPEHRHYATELGLISSRSSDLIRRLLTLSLPQPLAPAQPAEAASSPHPIPPPDAFRLQPSDVRRGASPPSEHPSLDHASVLRNLAPVLKRIAAGTATVSVLTPSFVPPTALSAEAIERIAVNLVRNAVEAIRKQQSAPSPSTHPHGEIRVALGVITGRLQLIVEDNGPGVPPPVAAAFMNPGHLPPTSQRGLGHRIVHNLVTSSGGQISVRTRPGHGTLFSMKWPLLSQSNTQSTTSACVPNDLETPSLYAAALTHSATPGLPPAPTAQKGLASC